MKMVQTRSAKYLAVGGALAVVLILAGGYSLATMLSSESDDETPATAIASSQGKPVVVRVVQPRLGGMDRTTTQPCSIQAFESVSRHAAVSGYVKTLNVDIGSKVKKDEVLAVIEVPELVKQLQHHKAVVEQAQSKVSQMQALKVAVEADLNVANASVKQAEARAKSDASWLKYRDSQFHRFEKLAGTKTIEDAMLDEYREKFEAAVEGLRASEESVVASKARVAAVSSKIVQAAADIDEARANVKVAEAEVEKTQELLNYAKITAPFDGVVTQRSIVPGDFVRAANVANLPVPLFTIDRTEKMRVVVQLPDRDVAFADVGDEATIEVDALPGKELKAAIARVAGSEDPQTRTMRIEIDLPNPTGKLCQGMYGYVTIVLEKSANVLALPASCIVNKTEKNKGSVFVVQAGKAMNTPVTIVGSNGGDVGVVGLKSTDQVILNPGFITNGTAVTISTKQKAAGR
jgi:HlyD family secretion protein